MKREKELHLMTYLSMLMATRLKIEEVEQTTSIAIYTSHTKGPKPQ